MATIQIYGTLPGSEPSKMQEKSITITENTITTIEPDNNYDGLSSVAITTNVEGDFIKLIQDDNILFLPKTGNYALTDEEVAILETLLNETPNIISSFLVLCECDSNSVQDSATIENLDKDAMVVFLSTLNNEALSSLYLINEAGNGLKIEITSDNTMDISNTNEVSDCYTYTFGIEDDSIVISNVQVYGPTE